MAVLPDAVEIWDYIPPEPAVAAVISDRYVIVVDGARDEFAVFDVVNETSDAFSGCGKMIQSGSTTGVRRNVVSHGGYAYTVGYVGSWSIIRIGPNGGVTTKPIPNTNYGGAALATVGISGGNLWYGWRIATDYSSFRVGWVDLTSWAITQATGAGDYRIACTPTTVYQYGTKRWNGSTGVALADGPYISFNLGNPQVDGNILWGVSGSNFLALDLTTGDVTTYGTGISFTGASVCHGPNNLVYLNQTASPYTGLAVIDKTNKTVGTWDYPIGRTSRLTLAYAAGYMWALAGEIP